MNVVFDVPSGDKEEEQKTAGSNFRRNCRRQCRHEPPGSAHPQLLASQFARVWVCKQKRKVNEKNRAHCQLLPEYQPSRFRPSPSRSGASTMPLLYPSILFQERMLGFAMGGLVGMGVFMYEQRAIWRSTAGLAETLSGGILSPSRGVQTPPPIMGREARDDLAHVWNSSIDRMFGSLIVSLSSKGW